MAPVNIKPGIRMLFLVIIYNLAILLYGGWRKYDDWSNLWVFAFILSIFQVFPDWFLSAQLNILVFPEDGLAKIGTVSGYMAGLWTIPIFLNRNGSVRPSVVATIIAQNMATAKAGTSRAI